MLVFSTQLCELLPLYPLWFNFLPCVNKYTVYAKTVCWGGGRVGGYGPQTDKHLPQSPFTDQFLDDDILNCPLWVLSFYTSCPPPLQESGICIKVLPFTFLRTFLLLVNVLLIRTCLLPFRNIYFYLFYLNRLNRLQSKFISVMATYPTT